MDRIILLALLGIPVLIVIHVAMFAQGLSPIVSTAWSQNTVLALHGHWDTPDPSPALVVKRTPEQGS